MQLDLRAVSIGMALATLGGILLLPAASAAAITEASQGSAYAITQPASPSTGSLITAWAASFAADRPDAVTSYPVGLLPTPGGTATVRDIAPGHIACVPFTLEIAWPAEKAANGAGEISAAVADQVSVAFSRNASGTIVGQYFVGSSSCEAPVPTATPAP